MSRESFNSTQFQWTKRAHYTTYPECKLPHVDHYHTASSSNWDLQMTVMTNLTDNSDEELHEEPSAVDECAAKGGRSTEN